MSIGEQAMNVGGPKKQEEADKRKSALKPSIPVQSTKKGVAMNFRPAGTKRHFTSPRTSETPTPQKTIKPEATAKPAPETKAKTKPAEKTPTIPKSIYEPTKPEKGQAGTPKSIYRPATPKKEQPSIPESIYKPTRPIETPAKTAEASLPSEAPVATATETVITPLETPTPAPAKAPIQTEEELERKKVEERIAANAKKVEELRAKIATLREKPTETAPESNLDGSELEKKLALLRLELERTKWNLFKREMLKGKILELERKITMASW